MGTSLDKLFNIGASIVVVALVTTILRNGSSAAQVINAVGQQFAGSLRAAQGI
jgi:hypothetical protein